MKKQNIYYITTDGDKVLIAENILATTFISSNGTILNYYVSIENWEKFKCTTNYTDRDLAYCLASEMVPGQIAPFGNFLVEIETTI